MDCKARAGEPTTLSSDDEDFASPSSSTPTGKGGANGHGHAGTSLHGSGHHGRHAGHLTFDIGHSSNSPVRSTLARPSRVGKCLRSSIMKGLGCKIVSATKALLRAFTFRS